MKKKILLLSLLLFSFLQAAETIDGEKPIKIVIPSYKNELWLHRNLNSVFTQEYNNYHVEYIDDASPDNTYDLVIKHIDKYKQHDRWKVIKNDTNKGALYNLYHAIHAADDNEIIITLDGDDWFPHSKVLKRINEAYTNNDVWLTYGQLQYYPGNAVEKCGDFPKDVIKNNTYRDVYWRSTHLRTFYAGLFKKIKTEDLQIDGHFLEVTWDLAFMYPMLEISGGRHMCMSEPLYVYNRATPLSDDKLRGSLQRRYAAMIQSVPQEERYTKIDSFENE